MGDPQNAPDNRGQPVDLVHFHTAFMQWFLLFYFQCFFECNLNAVYCTICCPAANECIVISNVQWFKVFVWLLTKYLWIEYANVARLALPDIESRNINKYIYLVVAVTRDEARAGVVAERGGGGGPGQGPRPGWVSGSVVTRLVGFICGSLPSPLSLSAFTPPSVTSR